MATITVITLTFLVIFFMFSVCHAVDTDLETTGSNHWGSCICHVTCPGQDVQSSDLSYIRSGVEEIQDSLQIIQEKINATSKAPHGMHGLARDCLDLQEAGYGKSGPYIIYVGPNYTPELVYCDMTTDGGGWTVFQRRMDGSRDFYQAWEVYAEGFGDVSKEFWLGNRALHQITHTKHYEMRVDLEDWEGDTRYAQYRRFKVASGENGFKLTCNGYTGDAGDSMAPHDGREFSTPSRGPSQNCVESYRGGWWYAECHAANLNGLYLRGQHDSYANGVNWHSWKGYHYSLKFTEMKLRPE